MGILIGILITLASSALLYSVYRLGAWWERRKQVGNTTGIPKG